jgi:uncharacterized integral membrane protein (TIGR00698 family)
MAGEQELGEKELRVRAGVSTERLGSVLLILGGSVSLVGVISPPEALALGMVLALLVGNPHAARTAVVSKWLLQLAVVALGFGMDLHAVARAGLHGFWFAAATISLTWLFGYTLGRWLRIHPVTANLVCAGTAICGGSAIAAVGSVVLAGDAEMSVAMGTVFLLNALALYVFPLAGHYLHLSQTQFGTWAGVAIHDISSVVGASSAYGHQALQVATAVKLSRALWIVPVSLVAAAVYRRSVKGNGDESGRVQGRVIVPWFIGLFLLASLARTLIPAVAAAAPAITATAEHALTLTLFLIGAGLARRTLRSVGVRPLLLGVILWVVISLGSLIVIERLV